MRHCTLRHTRGLLCWMGGALRVEADACVLAIRSGEVLCDGRDGSGGPVVIRGRQTGPTSGSTRGSSKQADMAEPTSLSSLDLPTDSAPHT